MWKSMPNNIRYSGGFAVLKTKLKMWLNSSHFCNYYICLAHMVYSWWCHFYVNDVFMQNAVSWSVYQSCASLPVSWFKFMVQFSSISILDTAHCFCNIKSWLTDSALRHLYLHLHHNALTKRLFCHPSEVMLSKALYSCKCSFCKNKQ